MKLIHNHFQPLLVSGQWSIPSSFSQHLHCPIAIVSPSTLPLFPCPFQFLLPQQLSLGTDRLRGAMVSRSCYRGREEVIEGLLIQRGCGRDVKPHSNFSFFPLFFWTVSLYCSSDGQHLSSNNDQNYFLVSSPSQDTLSSCCRCWIRCLRGMVLTHSSTFLDAVQR